MNPKLSEALSYASRGWRVFPTHHIDENGLCSCGRDCKPNDAGKHPRIGGGCNKATTDTTKIRAWWHRWPDANVAIATGRESGLFVVDVDPRHNGDKTLAELQEAYPDLTAALKTRTVSTGGGGQHFYYATDKPFKSANGIHAGIDIKADGGYIVAPPSNHLSGRHYALVDDIEPIALPAIIRDLFQEHPAKHPPDTPTEKIGEGNRNDWLARQAAAELRGGRKGYELEAWLHQLNALSCEPPLEPGEVSAIARSIAARFRDKNKSFKTIWQEAVIRSPQLKHGTRFALVGLSLYMNADGKDCWPTESTLEADLTMTRKTLREHFRVAEAAGYIKRYTRGRGRENRRGWSFGYIATLPD